jgi:hypothetical protein
MPWNETAGQVTRAFDTWRATDTDIRAFLELSRRWVTAAYDSEWESAERDFAKNFDPYRHETDGHVGVFHERVLGLWAKDYFWMLRSGALRDAVTALEVYAEQCLDEVLGHYVFGGSDGVPEFRMHTRVGPGHQSPSWPTLVRLFDALGFNIDTPEVKYIRALRHLLTHQRGQLRTEEQRIKFVSEADKEDWLVGDAYVGGDVPLGHDRLLQMLEQLAKAVRNCDQRAWPHAWGRGGYPVGFHDLDEGKQAVLERRFVD